MKLLSGDAVVFTHCLEVTPGGVVAVPAFARNQGIFIGYGAMMVDPDNRVAMVVPVVAGDRYRTPVACFPADMRLADW